MFRSIASAILASAALLASTGASAQTGAYYVATPAAAPAKDRLMTRATPWRLQGASFVAAQAPERDLVLCQLVAKDVGQLASFSAGGKAFDAGALDKCNAKASGAKVSIAKADTGAAATTN